MPKPNEQKAENPRFDAMKAIVAKRLDDVIPESGGVSLRQEMEAQGMEMADPNAELTPDTKDSDLNDELVGQGKDVTVNIKTKLSPRTKKLLRPRSLLNLKLLRLRKLQKKLNLMIQLKPP